MTHRFFKPELNIRRVVVLLAVLGVSITLLAQFYPLGVDWKETFGQLSLSNPYQVKSFLNPPFTVLFLPHRLLPLRWGNAVNLALNVAVLLLAVRRLGGGWIAPLLVFTCPTFFDLARTNNIDWLPLLGLVAGAQWGGALLLVSKPQALGGALLIWAKRDWRVLLVPSGALLASLVVWGFWPARIGVNPLNAPFNFSPFPAGLPYGAYLLWLAWRNDDPYLAAVSTPLFVPYIAPYSFTGVMAILASRYPKAALWFYGALWAFVIIEFRRIG